MEKERSKLELWLIVERNFNRIYDGFTDQKGICNVINVLESENLLTWSEAIELKNIIRVYKEKRVSFIEPYIWPKDERKPRRLFIQKQILKEIRKSN